MTSGLANAFVLHSGRDYGRDISVTSYGMGRAEALSRQRHCNLMAERADVLMIDCNVTFGSSGAPVFSQVGGRGRILALISSGGLYGGKQVAFGMKLPQRVAELKAQLRRSPVAAPDRRIKRIRVGSGTSAGGANLSAPADKPPLEPTISALISVLFGSPMIGVQHSKRLSLMGGHVEIAHE
ncbi:trypsin-like serine peptidase [Phaeobacter piscinae]|uniref:trypsin-like serine peptidase n=1 Tax=Phaeobacter piscinae TaxID=1580596 RepID=UPI003B968098